MESPRAFPSIVVMSRSTGAVAPSTQPSHGDDERVRILSDSDKARLATHHAGARSSGVVVRPVAAGVGEVLERHAVDRPPSRLVGLTYKSRRATDSQRDDRRMH